MSGTVRRAVVALALCAGLAPALTTPPSTAADPAAPAAAAAPADGVVVHEVPGNLRASPRQVEIHGQTTGGELVVRRETGVLEVGLPTSGDFVVDTQGDETAVDRPVRGLYGDRLVAIGSRSTTDHLWIPSRLAAEPAWTETAVPRTHRILSMTGDGLVLSTKVDNRQQLWLQPWLSDQQLPIEGVPAGVEVFEPEYARSDSAVVLFGWVPDAPSTRVVVDTAARRASTVVVDRPDCDVGYARKFGMSDDVLAWTTSAAHESTQRFDVCTMPLPSADSDEPTTVSIRPGVSVPGDDPGGPALLPVGDDVVVSRPSSFAVRLLDSTAPVQVLHPDGSHETLLAWGHDVVASGPGEVVAVGGTSAAAQSLRRVHLDGGDVVIRAVEPAKAHLRSISVDDGRVVVADDSRSPFAVVERPVSWGPDGGVGAVTASTVENRRVTTVVAGGQSTAWTNVDTATSVAWSHRDAAGEVRRGAVDFDAQATAVSGRWMLAGRRFLVDATTGNRTTLTSASAADLLDGVVYLPGTEQFSDAPGHVVAARDLGTGLVDLIEVAGCETVTTVRAAGSWLLVGCLRSDRSSVDVVLDRTGATEPRVVDLDGRQVELGNGFLLGRSGDGTLAWTDLADGDTTWRVLGRVDPAYSRRQSMFAANRGSEPTVAWLDGGTARAARLPVATSPPPDLPSSYTRPAVPSLTATAEEGRISLAWAPDPDGMATAYQVSVDGEPRRTRRLPGHSTSVDLEDLANGTVYRVTLTAIGVVGQSSTTVTARPVHPLPAPKNLRVEVREPTSSALVTWDLVQHLDYERAASVEVWFGQDKVASLTDSRETRAGFAVEKPTTGTVTVRAVGDRRTTSASSDPVSFPGRERVPPRAYVRALPPVTFSSAMAVRAITTDNVGLTDYPLDGRWRMAPAGRPLGPWTEPPSWQERPPGSLYPYDLRRGWTYCFSVRAHDVNGNVSPWSPGECTTVAMDELDLRRSAGWTTRPLRGAYLDSTVTSARPTSALSRTGIRASAGWLVTTTCPRCGRVGVLVDGTRIGWVNTYSAATRLRQVLPLPWGRARTGTVTLRPGPERRTVHVDGLALRNY